MRRLLLCVGMLAGLSACAHSPSYDPQDPLEKINRPILTFNLKADQYVLRPVAKTYANIVPVVARKSVDNFFSNLLYPTTIINDLLQAKFKQTGEDTLRFVLNTTIGLAGFVDVATDEGFVLHDEDLGQTLGRWGVGPGWYLMLPLLGPSDNRDLVGRIGDNWTQILTYVNDVTYLDRIGLYVVEAVNDRARQLSSDHLLDEQLDKYIFIRTAFLDIRQNKVYDGHPPDDDLGLDDADDNSKSAKPSKPTPPPADSNNADAKAVSP